jgi:hypothetical protein
LKKISPFNQLVGIRLVRIHKDGVTIDCKLRPELLNVSGVLVMVASRILLSTTPLRVSAIRGRLEIRMPQRSSKRTDFVQNARRMVDESIRPHETALKLNPSLISQVMAEMGRKGGKAGGKSRMESMGEKGRSEFGRAAVNARWAKYRAEKAKVKKS